MRDGSSQASSAPRNFRIDPVRSDEDLKATIDLFYEYTKWLDMDLSFQNYAEEMAGMPGKYAPPHGELFLARNVEGEAVGCIALRPLSEEACEMKRLWVRDSAKGSGLGKALAATAIETGKALGYRRIRLDTLPRMVAALKLYRSLGFSDIEAYYTSPIADMHFLELDLT